MNEIPGMEEIIKELKFLATPIDFDKLENDKILKKAGAYYRILDYKRLPEYVRKQIKWCRYDNKGNFWVKLPKSWKKTQGLYRKMTGKDFDE